MDAKRYLSDLLFLSPSFSVEEKKKIFEKYSQNDELLKQGIAILEDELQKIVTEYVNYENNLQKIFADFLKNFDNIEQKEYEKYKKIQQILEENKMKEESEKNFQDFNFSNFL